MADKNKAGSKEKAAQAEVPAFIGSADGITAVEVPGAGFAVAFEFDRQLSALMRGVPGAEFDKAQNAFLVPAASVDELGKAVGVMRTAHHFIAESLADITSRASGSGLDAARNNGAAVGVAAKVDSFIEPEQFYGGPILNMNGHFAAQLTGFGAKDGAAFVKIHRLADLDNSKIMKGDNVGIKYDAKFRGAVTDLSKSKSASDLAAEYDGNLGKAIDGVTVTHRGDKIGVAFDMAPELLARIRRIDGAAFNLADKMWEVPVDKKEFALRAVHDMRAEFLLDAKDAEIMKAAAESKIDGAKVSKAFTKDGQEHFGPVIAVGERFALQKTGADRFSMHHLAALSEKPEIGANLAVKYNKGVGAVVDQDKQRAQNKALGAGR